MGSVGLECGPTRFGSCELGLWSGATGTELAFGVWLNRVTKGSAALV